MSRYAAVAMFVGILFLSSLAGPRTVWANATDDPPQYEQLIKNLGSDDAAVRKAAADKLATAEAIPFLVQAVGGADDSTSGRAVEILVTLLDSDKVELASQAESAVAELEKSPRENVARLVGVLLEHREETAMQALHDLGAPANRQRDGFTIRIRDGWKGGNDGFAYLKRLRGPITLQVTLEDEPITIDRGWEGPSPWRRSEAEGIPPTTVQGLTSLHSLRQLESISLSMLATKDDLVLLTGLPQLKNLSLIFPDESTGSELAEVAKLGQLEQLRLFKSPNLDEHLEDLSVLPALKSIAIASSGQAKASGLAHLPKLVQLEALNLANVPDLGMHLPGLAALPHLKRLTLVGRSVTDSDLVHIGNLANLEELMLQGTAVTDDGYAHLRGLSQLRSLRLPWTAITDEAVPHLQQLARLEDLNVHGSFLSTAGATKLKQYLRNLKIDGAWLDPPPSAEHRKAVREIIRLGGGVSVTEVPALENPIKDWHATVLLGDSWHGGEEGLQLLTKLERIAVLDIKTRLSDSAADQLRQLKGLRAIILRDTGMTDDGLRFLGSLPNLKSVALVGPFTDAAVPYLSHTTAERVMAKQTQISEEGQQAIQRALQPNVQTAKRVEQMNEMGKARALVAEVCAPVPTDPGAKVQARQERERARGKLGGLGPAAVPAIYDAAQSADSQIRMQALLLLLRFGARNLMTMEVSQDKREAMIEEIQEVFKGLADSAGQPSGIERTDEEKALIQLGAFGGGVIGSPFERGGYRVYIFAEWSKGDEGLSCLAHLPSMRSLDVYCQDVTGKGLAAVQSLPDLMSLTLAMRNIDARCLENLHGLAKLVRLNLETPVSEETMKSLVGLDGLTGLSVRGVSDAGLQYIGQLPQLKNLGISGNSDFTGAGLKHLAGATQLESLSISDAQSFTGDGLQQLAELTSLRSLSFTGTGVMGPAIAHLTRLPALEELTMLLVPLSKEGIQHVGEAKQLKRLTIQDSTLLDDDLKYLADLPQLESLVLKDNGISDEGLVHLTKLPSLRRVDLEGTFVSSEGQSKLYAALPNQEQAARMMRRESQTRDSHPPVSPEYLATVRAIVAYGACIMPDQAGCRIMLFPHWSGGDEGLALLDKLGDVHGLNIRTLLTDTAIPYLKKLTRLEYIGLEADRMSDVGIDELKKALPNTNITRPDGT
jgi:hypothetical protein